MKKANRIITSLLVAALVFSVTGCSSRKLSNKYVTVENYQGVEIEKVVAEEVTEEDIDKVVAHMMSGYVSEHDLPEDTQITDEIVKETMSDSAATVKEYREELRKQIQETKDKSVRTEEETRVWEKVMDNSTVKSYPKKQLKVVKGRLVDLYKGYAAEAGVEYEDYLEAIKLTDEDLDEAAKASVKQELVADIIADKYGLKPTEEDFQKALEEYAAEYKFSTVDLLLEAVSEDELRAQVIQDNVKSWLADRCKMVDTEDKAQ